MVCYFNLFVLNYTVVFGCLLISVWVIFVGWMADYFGYVVVVCWWAGVGGLRYSGVWVWV